MSRKRLLAASLAASIVVGTVSAAAFPDVASAAWIGKIESSVSFRTGPGTDNSRIRYLQKGETVTILQQVNAYWFKVEDKNGKTGYVSSNQKYISTSGSPEQTVKKNTGLIVSSVSLREGPSTQEKRIRYAQKGETVTILGKVNAYWYHVRDPYGNTGYLSTSEKYIQANFSEPAPAPAPTPTPTPTPVPAPTPPPAPTDNQGLIVSSVSLREGPGTSYTRIRYAAKGETVDILAKTNEYWYKVRDRYGNVGYISTSEKYISANYTPPVIAPEDVPVLAQRVIDAGMRYLGTPYEYGSDRNTTTTFDCSDFVRTAFLEGAGISFPSNSRTQGDYVKELGRVSSDWKTLKPGDILFFMSYKGSKASDYAGVNKDTERISHNAIYLGDGKILHTYSQESGGVRIDTMEGQWEHRFLFGGSAM